MTARYCPLTDCALLYYSQSACLLTTDCFTTHRVFGCALSLLAHHSPAARSTPIARSLTAHRVLHRSLTVRYCPLTDCTLLTSHCCEANSLVKSCYYNKRCIVQYSDQYSEQHGALRGTANSTAQQDALHTTDSCHHTSPVRSTPGSCLLTNE